MLALVLAILNFGLVLVKLYLWLSPPRQFSSANKVDAPARRESKDFDILLGHSFGTSKRFFDKRNFDEIDAAGFNDLSKRNFDEIDNAGFKDYLRKRNFDEIDAAGFNDFSKRGKDFAGEGQAKGEDVKKNFDEIDAAGFNDLSKRDYNQKFNPFIYEIRRQIREDLAAFIEEYMKGNFDKNPPVLWGSDGKKFLQFLIHYSAGKYGKHHGHGPNHLAVDDLINNREKVSDSTFNTPGNGGKYDVPPYYQPYYKGKHGYYPHNPRYQLSNTNGKQPDYPPFYPFFNPPYYAPYYDEKPGENFSPSYSNLEKHRLFNLIERIIKYLENKFGIHWRGFGSENTIPRSTYN